jgi:hypothetical protein
LYYLTDLLFTFLNRPTRYGIYPLTVFAPVPADACGQRPVSPDTSVSVAAETPEPVDVEARRVSNMICDVKPKDDGAGYQVYNFIYIN